MKKIIIGIVILMALTAQAFAQAGAKGKEAVKDDAVKQEEEKTHRPWLFNQLLQQLHLARH